MLASWVPEKYLDIDYYPISNTEVEVRYWDTAACLVISTEKLAGGQVTQDGETQVTAKLTPPGGYSITGWNVQLPDGQIQYEGEFKNGTAHGKGAYYSENGELIYSGQWKNGDYAH